MVHLKTFVSLCVREVQRLGSIHGHCYLVLLLFNQFESYPLSGMKVRRTAVCYLGDSGWRAIRAIGESEPQRKRHPC